MKIDYQRVILNLRNAGLTYEAISKKCNIDAQQIGHLARYETYEPKLSKAIALLDLHYDLCRDKHNLKSIGQTPTGNITQIGNVTMHKLVG